MNVRFLPRLAPGADRRAPAGDAATVAPGFALLSWVAFGRHATAAALVGGWQDYESGIAV
jgi:hypothetical protein